MKFADHASEVRWKATAAMNNIIRDLTDRSGLGDAWNEIDADVRDEIREVWTEAIEAAFREGERSNG